MNLIGSTKNPPRSFPSRSGILIGVPNSFPRERISMGRMGRICPSFGAKIKGNG